MDVRPRMPAVGRTALDHQEASGLQAAGRTAAGDPQTNVKTDISNLFTESIAIKMVPVSAGQLSVLESIERALLSLYLDFQRDVGAPADDVAGGLHRLTAALGAITSFWKEEAEDLATIEGWRAALTEIRTGELDANEAQRLAARVLR